MNQQILSQDEVDALLQGITGESQKIESEEVKTEGIRDYNIASQEKIVRGRMPTMEIIGERFARNIRLGLFNLMPVLPLDGGRALWCVLSALFGAQTGERAADGAAGRVVHAGDAAGTDGHELLLCGGRRPGQGQGGGGQQGADPLLAFGINGLDLSNNSSANAVFI